MVRIGIIADFDPNSETHAATNQAFQHSSSRLANPAIIEWIATDTINEDRLSKFNALLVGTGLYENRTNVLKALHFARERDIPTLATCGGFQHMILEYAQNVVGIKNAAHEEFDPLAEAPVIVKLSCSLRGQTFDIKIRPNSIASSLYNSPSASENYYCSFGINPSYQDALFGKDLRLTGEDDNGEIRITELGGHRFYMGTLFVPQVRSKPDLPHPLVDGLISAASRG